MSWARLGEKGIARGDASLNCFCRSSSTVGVQHTYTRYGRLCPQHSSLWLEPTQTCCGQVFHLNLLFNYYTVQAKLAWGCKAFNTPRVAFSGLRPETPHNCWAVSCTTGTLNLCGGDIPGCVVGFGSTGNECCPAAAAPSVKGTKT